MFNPYYNDPFHICSPCANHTRTEWKEEWICVNGTSVKRIAEYNLDPPFPTGQARYFSVKGAPILEPVSFTPGICGSTTPVDPTPVDPTPPFTKTLLNHSYGVIPASEHGKGKPTDVVLTDPNGEVLNGGVTINPSTGDVTIQSIHPRTILVTIN